MLNIACIGCGTISGIYLRNCARLPGVRVVACVDRVRARAEARAAEFGIDRVLTLGEALTDDSIDLVLNLTVPLAHFEVAIAAVKAGKHVYNEKPLTVDLAEARSLLAEAAKRNVRIGCAPDTFLGAGLQTCRTLIDSGAIGRPVAAAAFMTCRGHESWHPDPAFYYQRGGGPMFDMGPYYVTALVSLLGPVRRVCGSAAVSFQERTITSEPKRDQTIRVEVPTHVAGVLDFESGAIATIITSFDVCASRLPIIEIYGADATLAVPDPNGYGGPVQIRRGDHTRNAGFQPASAGSRHDWEDVPLVSELSENWRGLGVADMAAAIREEGAKTSAGAAAASPARQHRASGDLALHVLEVMHAIHEASARDHYVTIQSRPPRPDPMSARGVAGLESAWG
jgi:predicted dehydrogenase